MKKIVLVTGNTKGGIIQFLETIETELNGSGYEVVVVAPSEIEQKLQNKKNYIYYQAGASATGFVNKVCYFLSKRKMLCKISKEVIDLKADLIWLIDNPKITINIGLALTSSKVPMLLTLHDAGRAHPTNETLYQKLRRKYTHFLSDKLEHKANNVLLLSKASYDTYALMKPQNKGKLVYFCLGAHVPKVEEVKPDEVTENQFHLFFGRIDKYKGVGTLLKAFSQLDNHKYKLVVAGKGKLSKEEVEQCNQIKSDVILINRYISDEEMVWLFNHARSVILPYIEATQSGVIPIAYKFGVPVVVSNVDGLTQFVENKETGFICQKEKDYVKALQKIEDDDIRKTMSEKTIEYHLKHMNWKKNISAVLDSILN